MRYAITLGLHGLRRHPRTMLLAILTLALGLSSTMTMITLIAMLSADPLPGISQNLHLGWVESRQSENAGQSPDRDYDLLMRTQWKLADVQALIAAHPQQRLAALSATQLPLSNADGSRQASTTGVLTIGPLPSMFGVGLRHGRYWSAREERERTPVAIIDYRTSLKLFGRENGTGQDVRIGRSLFRVVGISDGWAPRPALHMLQNQQDPWIELPNNTFVPALATLDANVPVVSQQVCDDSGSGGFRFNELDTRACRWLTLWAELSTPEQVGDFQRQLLAYARQRHADGVFQRPPAAGSYSVPELLQRARVIPHAVRLNLWLALALLGLCLLNVAGLLAARLLRRSGELGVRRVLGASRGAVVTQCLIESAGAGLLGGLLALPLTLFGLWVVRLQDRGYATMAQFRPGLFLLLLALALVCGLLVGLLPAWRAARLAPALQVKSL